MPKEVCLLQDTDIDHNKSVFSQFNDLYSAEQAGRDKCTEGVIKEFYSVCDLLEYLDENKLELVGTVY